MPVKCKDIIGILNSLAPLELAEDWDNPGLLVGRNEGDVKKVLVALDATTDVILEAIENRADMIVTHHPILFSPIKKITDATCVGKNILSMIENKIAHFAAHTNLDVAKGGTNDAIANMAGLIDIDVLDKTKKDDVYKLQVYVPYEYAKRVKKAVNDSKSTDSFDRYKDCCFMSEGTGSFTPLEGAIPNRGNIGVTENVEEIKIETVLLKKEIKKVIDAMIKAHPYEEVAYDIIKTEGYTNVQGVGRIGILPKEQSFKEFSLILKNKLGLESMRIVGDENKCVKKIAICTGSGMSYLKNAIDMKADVLITGDIRYHEAQNAIDNGLCLIDATHYASERIIVPVLCEYIRKKANELNFDIEVLESQVNGQVFKDI